MPPDLFPVVYDELRKLAAVQMANEPVGHTLDATALVHEAYLRLGDQPFDSRGHFFAAAAEAMRRILIDHARAKLANKRGGGSRRVALDVDQLASGGDPGVNLIELDEALSKLAAVDPQAAAIVNLRYFAGLTVPQAADALGLSPRSTDRLWVFATAWLYRELEPTA